MANKIYAVKVGRNTGIFETWDECKTNVDGYPGALFKSFKKLTDAYDYLEIENTQTSLFDTVESEKTNLHDIVENTQPNSLDMVTNTQPDLPYTVTKKQSNLVDTVASTESYGNNIIVSSPDLAIAYVDGSYNIATKVFGYGVVLFTNGEEIHLYDSDSDEEMAQMRNVAGEIYGSLAAMEYAIKHNIKELTIYHDYMGISKWCLGEWKTNKKGTILYKKYYDRAKKQVNIHFEKVKGHSGNKYNDLADALAKKACGIE